MEKEKIDRRKIGTAYEQEAVLFLSKKVIVSLREIIIVNRERLILLLSIRTIWSLSR